MEFNNQNGADVLNGTAKTIIKDAAQNGAAKANGTTAKKEHANGKPEAEKAKPGPVKEEKPDGKHEQPKAGPAGPAAEEPKKEEPQQAVEQPKEVLVPKPVLNLEGKLRIVEDLHRRSIQRINLISRIKQLEVFQVNLATENDELEDNPYQGCRLIIKDDKNREFVTTTPGLIRLVSQFIFEACHEKLAEIEAAIVFPNA